LAAVRKQYLNSRFAPLQDSVVLECENEQLKTWPEGMSADVAIHLLDMLVVWDFFQEFWVPHSSTRCCSDTSCSENA